MSQQDLPDASWSGTNLALFFLVFLTGTELFEISGLIKLVKKSHGQPETEPCFLTLSQIQSLRRRKISAWEDLPDSSSATGREVGPV